jgi:sugar lactone lactonase YvrE
MPSVSKKSVLLLVLALSTTTFSVTALAEGTRVWEQSKFEDLVKGTPKGVALRSSGGLELAPAFKTVATLPSTYVWSIASDAAGNIYAAAGSPARVYRITPDGRSSTIFEPQELQVQSLLVDKSGAVYAATAPDGKVYKIASNAVSGKPKKNEPIAAEPSWSAAPYFDPETKYIWDIALDNAGNLYVATGDRGEIFKVTPNGQHSLFFKSDEVHIRVLAVDPKGNLIAGSDGSGLIYRIAPNGQAFVLYSAQKREITSLAVDGAGNIYAAGAGEKRVGPASSASFSSGTINLSRDQSGPGASTTAAGTVAAASTPFPAPGMGANGGSEVYRIAPDGSPMRLWTSHEDLVYALGFDQRGRLVAGTGNRGHIFAINGVDDFTDLVKASGTQITAFTNAPGGGLYASSSNLGKIFVLGSSPESEGSYESDVLDARVFSRWGRAKVRFAGPVELQARSGNVDNPDRNWSPWTTVDLANGEELNVPAARFVQWKAVLHAGTAAPRVDSVQIYYLPKNVAPQVDEVTVQAGYRYQPIAHVTGTEPQSANGPRFDPPPPGLRDHDSVGIRWSAHDDNDDQLEYFIYYRGDGESRWLLLKNNLSDRFYSFDASLLPDGGYTAMVEASDAPSHSPGEALSAQRESARFEVDTTPPTISELTAANDGSRLHVHFRAVDTFSPIRRAEYSLDAGDWQFVEPIGQLSDSKTEEYDFLVPLTAAGDGGSTDHVLVVRAYDRFENLGTAKAVVRAKAAGAGL